MVSNSTVNIEKNNFCYRKAPSCAPEERKGVIFWGYMLAVGEGVHRGGTSLHAVSLILNASHELTLCDCPIFALKSMLLCTERNLPRLFQKGEYWIRKVTYYIKV